MKVTVPLDGRQYDVVVQSGALERVARLAATEKSAKVAIVGDARLAPVLKRLARCFEQRGNATTVVPVAANENLKSLRTVEPLYGKLLRAGLDRRSTIVGVGGGTIGDAIGFLAATFLRGVRFVSVPTTLLADVDSAIGGKTGLNHEFGKNLIGVFAQPNLVVVDPSLLRSLDRRDRVSGLGEIVKYGLIADARLYRTVQTSWRELLALREPLLSRTIARCVAIKARVVAADEREQTGLRAQLNFGHTVAHALENVAGYGLLRHGEAVIVGMRAAVSLSELRGHLSERVAGAIDMFLRGLPVPDEWKRYSARRIAAATRHDKKRGARGVKFVLLDRIGHTLGDDGVGGDELMTVLRAVGFAR
ncbi:MAG: 3-dehydroquinate synthase [Vulcanimicrobiaceae bacterium]